MVSFEVVICIVNKGYSEVVIEASRIKGAGGATILTGRGGANPEAEKLFNMAIEPEKEVIMILVRKDRVADVLSEINERAGLASESQGIAFTLPVEKVVGLPARQFIEK